MIRHPEPKRHKNLSDEISWTVMMLNQIIRNDMHCGAMVGHKREQATVCSKETRSVERSKRVIIPRMHHAVRDDILRYLQSSIEKEEVKKA